MKAKLPGLPGVVVVVVRNSQALSSGRIPSPSYLPVNQHAPLKEFQRAVDYFPLFRIIPGTANVDGA